MTNPYQAPAGDLPGPGQPPPVPGDDGTKTRHGCVTAYFIFMIIANAGTAFVTLTTSDTITSVLPDMPSWGIPVLVSASALNVVFAVLLFRWMKIGFYGFIGTSAIAAFINVTAGIDMTQVIGGVLGVVLLFAIMQIGSPKTAWSQME